MKCKECGAEIENGLMYCPNCGQSIQLVPDYNVLEEEVLLKVVEDKNKAKDDKFATGVYQVDELAKEEKSKTEKKEVKYEPKIFTKKIRLMIYASAAIILAIGFWATTSYFMKHNYSSLMKLAEEAEENKEYAKALNYYEEASGLEEANGDTLFALGRMYYEVKDYKKAVNALQEALKEYPKSTEIYTYLLESLDSLGDTETIYNLADSAPTDEIKELISTYIMLAPEFSIAGGQYSEDQLIQLTTDGDYQIFYTLNGKNPTTSGKLYTRPIKITEGTTTIKAVAQNDSGEFSEVVSAEYTITYKELEMPVVSPVDGVYTDLIYISIEIPENCVAYYTWDGTDPSENGIEYTEPFPIIEGSSVLSVAIVDEDGNVSPIYRGNYIYQP